MYPRVAISSKYFKRKFAKEFLKRRLRRCRDLPYLRIDMLRAFLTIFVGLALITPSQSAELGTRDEAVAMVKRLQEKFKKDGSDATFKAITQQAAEFQDRDLYVFVYDMNGINVAHGANSALVGENRINLRDQQGKFLIRELISVAKNFGSGWIDYCWSNPVSVEDKSGYVERLGDNYIVGVSVFRPKEDLFAGAGNPSN
jgi:signal transduction histidine kinase